MVTNKTLRDIGGRVQRSIVELIAESQMLGDRSVRSFCLDAFHQLFTQAKRDEFIEVMRYHDGRRGMSYASPDGQNRRGRTLWKNPVNLAKELRVRTA